MPELLAFTREARRPHALLCFRRFGALLMLSSGRPLGGSAIATSWCCDLGQTWAILSRFERFGEDGGVWLLVEANDQLIPFTCLRNHVERSWFVNAAVIGLHCFLGFGLWWAISIFYVHCELGASNIWWPCSVGHISPAKRRAWRRQCKAASEASMQSRSCARGRFAFAETRSAPGRPDWLKRQMPPEAGVFNRNEEQHMLETRY